MFDWLKRKKVASLSGAPAVRRQKTYSAESGYVYQYFYEGYRQVEAGLEYVFDVSADRKTSFPVSVFIKSDAIAPWQRHHERALTSTEQYAIAKMALFAAFDRREEPQQMRAEVELSSDDVERILETLRID